MPGSNDHAHGWNRQGRTALFWGAAVFTALQVAVALPEPWQVFDRDPAFTDRFHLLQRRRAENPDGPLVLFLGSSRVLLGIRPEVLREGSGGDPPCIFNFGEAGTDSLVQLLRLNRLLNCGVRPDILIVEVWPPNLNGNFELGARLPAAEQPLEWSDLCLLRRCTGNDVPWRRWVAQRFFPLYYDRQEVQEQWGNGWLALDPPRPPVLPVDDWGWRAEAPVRDQRRQEQLHEYYRGHHESRLQAWAPSSLMRHVFRELVALGRAHGSTVVLLFLPESRAMRGWYPPEVAAAAKSYLDDVSRECAVPWIDARDWQPDEDFIDPVHLNCEGATAFSRRLGREVLRPLLEKQQARCVPSVDR